MSKISHKDITESLANMATIWNGMSKYAADIAHARRVLYQAYLAEGFTEGQALELCKVLNLG